MDPETLASTARKLIETECPEYSFQIGTINSDEPLLAVTDPDRKVIGFDRDLSMVQDDLYLFRTILHEIAHARVAPGVLDHGSRWRSEYMKLLYRHKFEDFRPDGLNP